MSSCLRVVRSRALPKPMCNIGLFHSVSGHEFGPRRIYLDVAGLPGRPQFSTPRVARCLFTTRSSRRRRLPESFEEQRCERKCRDRTPIPSHISSLTTHRISLWHQISCRCCLGCVSPVAISRPGPRQLELASGTQPGGSRRNGAAHIPIAHATDLASPHPSVGQIQAKNSTQIA